MAQTSKVHVEAERFHLGALLASSVRAHLWARCGCGTGKMGVELGGRVGGAGVGVKVRLWGGWRLERMYADREGGSLEGEAYVESGLAHGGVEGSAEPEGAWIE